MNTSKNKDAADRLGSEPVGKLLLQFSIPAITGMLVNALYNIVDRMFVGKLVGEAALGGLALTLPLMTIFMAFAMLFGFGSANLISMQLGQGKREEAAHAIEHCFWLLLAIGLLFTLLGVFFLDPILKILQAQEGSEALSYARAYLRIILFGAPTGVIGFGLSHCARAQGFPMITMISMLIGAILNIILDPIFIAVLGLGVRGAAFATIISQAASSVFVFLFVVSPKAVVRLRLAAFRPNKAMIAQIALFGSSQFFLQFVMSGIQVVLNALVIRYGNKELGAGGGDVALAGMNIVGSIAMLILMPVFGINQGAQPILGYNYGAQRFPRVVRAYVGAVGAATLVCVVGYLIVQLFPIPLINVFTPSSGGSDALMTFTPRAMRFFNLLLFLAGFQIVSSNLFVATGRPRISIFLSLLRQCIALLPCLLIFSTLWGLTGLLFSMPAADAFSFIITVILVTRDMRKLRSAQPAETTAQP